MRPSHPFGLPKNRRAATKVFPAQEEQRCERQKRPRQPPHRQRLEIVERVVYMTFIRHLAQQPQYVFLIHQREELVAALTVGREIPAQRQYECEYCRQEKHRNGAECLLSTQQQEYPSDATGQYYPHRSLREYCPTHRKHGPKRYPPASALHPSVQEHHRHDDEHREQHVNAAVHPGAVNLEGCQREHCGEECRRHVPALGVEPEHHADDHRQRQGGWQSRRCLADISLRQRAECHRPMEERWLVGDVSTVVDRQNPVAALQHGQCDHRLARLAFRVVFRQWQECHHHRRAHSHHHGEHRFSTIHI